MKAVYTLVSCVLVLVGCGFVVDSLANWDNFAVVAASAGWAIALTGLLHALVALGLSDGSLRWVAAVSSAILVALVVSGWMFASFAREWPEIT